MKLPGHYIIVLFAFLAASCHTANTSEKSLRPNIIFIISDDISPEDIGAYGNPLVKTPNINRLAADGLKFNNMFVTASSCSPSRSSILTGRYPHNTGAAELHTPLPGHLTYFPEQLKNAGYYTALLGKWHEGPETARAYDTLIAGVQHNGPGGEEQWINILQGRPDGQPFFFWLSPFDAHRNWDADSFHIRHDPATEVWVPETLVDDEATRKDLASYYNEIGRLDHHIGLLQEALKEAGIDKNTIIIFTADNARAFPNSKTRLHDRGTKTPFIVYWPDGIKQPAIVESLVSTIDIAPTLLHIAGISPAKTIQGKSFDTLLHNPAAPFRNYVFAEHNWHDYEAYERSVRTKDHLYIYNGRPEPDNGGPIDANQSPSAQSLKKAHRLQKLTTLQRDVFTQPRQKEEFYVIGEDSLQVHNQIGNPAYAAQIQSLKDILRKWQEETGDTEPENLTKDWYHRETGAALPGKDIRGEMPGSSKNATSIHQPGPF